MKAHRVVPILALVAFSGLALADRYTPEVATFLATAPQEERGTQMQKGFTALDANHDGRVSAQEAAQHPLPEAFWLMDRNRDGFLTPREYNYRPN